MRDMRIDEVMPAWHFRERHTRHTIATGPALLTAVHDLTWADVPVMAALMRVRSVGRIPRERSQRILDGMSAIGFALLDRTDDEVVFGALGRPWKAGGDAPDLNTRADPRGLFVGFTAAGWAKIAVNFHVADGELSTETRVWLTDERSRRAFRRYWLLVRPFSGLIRRHWLAAIVRRPR